MSTEPVPPESTENAGPATPDAAGEPAPHDTATSDERTSTARATEGDSEADAGRADTAHGEGVGEDGAGGTLDPDTDTDADADADADSEGEGEETLAAGARTGADAGGVGAGDAGAEDSANDGSGPAASEGGDGDGDAAAKLSEAQAELAAQKLERERIERRKAEKAEPIDSGAKLSGKAADLLAAVRAVEGGAKPPLSVFAEPAPAPRRPAPEPVRRPQPVAAAPAAETTPVPAAEAVEEVRRVLAAGGAPESLAPQAAAALGEGATELLREDPWQLLRVPGVRPEQADGFARALLGPECAPDDERRGRAVTVWLLEQAALAGHTALELPTLVAALGRQAVPDADAAVQGTLAEGEALVFQDALDAPRAGQPAQSAGTAEGGEESRGEGGEEGGEDGEDAGPVRVLVGLERYALAEESLADALARVVNSLAKEDSAPWESVTATASGSTAELLRAVAGHGLVLHTGGDAARAEPAALLSAARTLGLRAVAACHTPDGRHRFAALLGEEDATVVTVPGLLAGAEGPGRDADGAFALDLLVLLDAPQLDVESAAMLAESLPDGARLVLSGDPAVLWSAGPGRVFADLLAARMCPQVASRTPDPGPIGELVSGVGIGELNQVDAPGKEIVIVPVREAGEAVHRTVQLVADSVPRAFGITPEETVAITPGHGGAAGTRALNAALKERLNPGPGRFGGFDPGDRIAYSPAPGRTVPGRVVTADADGLHLSCAGVPVVVPRERVEQAVRHGWALTAHQAVGSRWPAAVVVLPGDGAQALSRPWVYTAFGRAERHLSVVHGVDQALPRAVAEVPAKPRTTRLPVLLRTQVPAAQ